MSNTVGDRQSLIGHTALNHLTTVSVHIAMTSEGAPILSEQRILQGTVFNEMRSKTKVIQKPITSFEPKDFPDWSFDGSSTGQAEGNNSDCILK